MAKTDKRRKSLRLPAQVLEAVRAAEDKKAIEVTVLDLRKASGFTDYFLICSGSNPRQIRAIADSVMAALADEGVKPAHVEGYDRSEWVLLDYFDFIVHIFAPETRAFYGLERLWGNAERVEVPAPKRRGLERPGERGRGRLRRTASFRRGCGLRHRRSAALDRPRSGVRGL
jgi:ribosome-associated protein